MLRREKVLNRPVHELPSVVIRDKDSIELRCLFQHPTRVSIVVSQPYQFLSRCCDRPEILNECRLGTMCYFPKNLQTVFPVNRDGFLSLDALLLVPPIAE